MTTGYESGDPAWVDAYLLSALSPHQPYGMIRGYESGDPARVGKPTNNDIFEN